MSSVLEGIRVLDFGRYIAGPYCATMLADMGADVIRIEKVTGSEDRYTAPVGDGGDGATFLQMARNKKGMTLNPRKPGGRKVLGRLSKPADVVVANLPLPTLQAMGIDYESLKAIRPDIILTMISAFGIDGLAVSLGRGQVPGGVLPDRHVHFVATFVANLPERLGAFV